MRNKGFTLVELMIVVVIIAIFAAIAIPSYQQFVRRAIASHAEQEMQRLATLLERHKSRNLNYRNFETTSVAIPTGKTGSEKQYTVYIRDATTPVNDLKNNEALGQGWVILAEANSKINYGTSCTTCNVLQEQNYSFLLTSSGIRCKTKDKLVESEVLTSTKLASVTPCGANSESW